MNGDFRKGSHFLVLMLLTYVWVIFECAFRHLCFLYDLSVREFETLAFEILPKVLLLLFFTILIVSILIQVVCKDTHVHFNGS